MFYFSENAVSNEAAPNAWTFGFTEQGNDSLQKDSSVPKRHPCIVSVASSSKYVLISLCI
jgi:hypothetical protein